MTIYSDPQLRLQHALAPVQRACCLIARIDRILESIVVSIHPQVGVQVPQEGNGADDVRCLLAKSLSLPIHPSSNSVVSPIEQSLRLGRR
jgi:hypothetical protein